jgi:hypothetical protein
VTTCGKVRVGLGFSLLPHASFLFSSGQGSNFLWRSGNPTLYQLGTATNSQGDPNCQGPRLTKAGYHVGARLSHSMTGFGYVTS